MVLQGRKEWEKKAALPLRGVTDGSSQERGGSRVGQIMSKKKRVKVLEDRKSFRFADLSIIGK